MEEKQMKKRFIILAALLSLVLMFSMAMAASVNPVYFPDWQSGNAEFECAQAGAPAAQFAYKIDEWDEENGMDGTYTHEGNTITIYNSTGSTFSWSSVYPVVKVIVKGGPNAQVYYYPSGSYGDTNLVAPVNPNNDTNYDISHVTFCFNPPAEQWMGETAWAAGTRYVTRGNWATYTAYTPGTTVTLFAGQTMNAGTVHFSAPADGVVTITITLNAGWRFEDVEENVKIQGYETAPGGSNPSPGHFANKGYATASPYSIEVPVSSFYGVHVNVERLVTQ
jgi:hypothetical protein